MPAEAGIWTHKKPRLRFMLQSLWNSSDRHGIDSSRNLGRNHLPRAAFRRWSVKKKIWHKPVVKLMKAGAAETAGGSAQEGGTGPATHAS